MRVTEIIATLLWLYFVVLLVRFVFDLVRALSRDWEPHGLVLIFAEAVYTITDPPLKLLRKLIPPLKLGGIALDLSFLVLVIVLQVAIQILVSM